MKLYWFLNSVFEVYKIGGHFDPLGLLSGGNFQILGVISYIMYIVVTSDVNKNATFWEVLLWLQVSINAENTIFQSNFQRWASVRLQSILSGYFSWKYIISVIWINWESGWFLCFKSRTNLVTEMTLESQSYMCLVISAFSNETIICQLTNGIIHISTYQWVNFINVNLK